MKYDGNQRLDTYIQVHFQLIQNVMNSCSLAVKLVPDLRTTGRNAEKGKPRAIVKTNFVCSWVIAGVHSGLNLHEIDVFNSLTKTSFPWAPEWASERTSERSGARERSEQCGASKWVSSASERASGWANGLVLYASISYSFYPLCDEAPLARPVTPPSSRALPTYLTSIRSRPMK